MSQFKFFADRDIVIIGAQEHAAAYVPKLHASIQPTHLYPDGPLKLDETGLSKIGSIDEITALHNPFVIIARSASHGAVFDSTAKRLLELQLEFDHIDHLVDGATISTGLLQRMGKASSVDGAGNRVQIEPGASGKFLINFRRGGRGNVATIGKTHILGSKVQIDFFGSEANVGISSGTTFVNISIEIGDHGSVTIGEDCMFSHGIVIGQTDQHPIFEVATGKRLNYGKPISIGNHVWVGRDVKLLGGFTIGDGSIVGAGSTTSSRFPKNVLIVGSPAHVLREGVMWARDTLASEPIDHIDQCSDKQGLHWASESAQS